MNRPQHFSMRIPVRSTENESQPLQEMMQIAALSRNIPFEFREGWIQALFETWLAFRSFHWKF
jgi:hypothetical protein